MRPKPGIPVNVPLSAKLSPITLTLVMPPLLVTVSPPPPPQAATNSAALMATTVILKFLIRFLLVGLGRKLK
jgi:hypothetical protein